MTNWVTGPCPAGGVNLSHARFTLSPLVTLTTRNPDGATVIGPPPAVPVTGPVGWPDTGPPPPVGVVLDARITVYEPTGGGPYSASAALTMAACAEVSGR